MSMFGYAPTASMLGSGGYESTVYCGFFGLAEVEPGVEEAMMKGFEAVAKQLASSVGERGVP